MAYHSEPGGCRATLVWLVVAMAVTDFIIMIASLWGTVWFWLVIVLSVTLVVVLAVKWYRARGEGPRVR